MARPKKNAEAAAAESNAVYTTPKDEICPETGLYMGKPGSRARTEYERIMKMPRAKRDRYVKACKERYIYDPAKRHMNCQVIFICELLAASAGDKNIFANFIADHAIDAKTREDEVNAVGVREVVTKGRSIFDYVNGQICWPSHRWLGYFKAKTGADRRDDETIVYDLSSYKGILDENTFFTAKNYPLIMPESANDKTGTCDRAMPGDGFKRPTSIKSSETVPPGTVTSFVVQTNVKNVGKKGEEKDYLDVLRECMDAGALSGTGEWRGSGKKGTFLWEELDDDGHVIGGTTLLYIGCTSEDPDFKDRFYEFLASRELGTPVSNLKL